MNVIKASLINATSNVVVNNIVVDVDNYTPAENHFLNPILGDIGDIWTGSEYIPVERYDPVLHNRIDNIDFTVKPLEDLKESIKSEISTIRYNKENQGIIYANSVFSTDERSRVNYIGAVSQAQANNQFTVRWRKKDPETNEAGFITLDANSLIAVYGSGLHYITSCFYTEDYYHQQIEAAPDVNTCITIYESRETGWPSRNYGP